tara:strand:- start:1514 stop:2956 length:1443 start_codon:yes stop_codon:yes gene_type:complete
MKQTKIIPIILCGGRGSRLWPLSRQCFPKQFLSLSCKDNRTQLQRTFERISDLKNIMNPIIICNEEHRFLVAEQMRNIGVTPSSIILEPMRRNTAPAITLGALKALEEFGDSILLVLSADHKIEDNEQFLKVIREGVIHAKKDKLVTFGVVPTFPETGYGYIEGEFPFEEKKISGIPIKRFIEKPNQSEAKKLFESKKFSWNSGIFMFKSNIIINELRKNQPLLVESCKESLKNSSVDLDFLRIDYPSFEKTPNISIDLAVMEKTDLGIIIPLKAGWSDIGTWNSLWLSEEKDSTGNTIIGNVIDKNSENSYIRSENRLLVTLGVKDLIIVETDDAVLVADKNSTNEIKDIVNYLIKKEKKEGIQNSKVFRPWGNYTSIAEGEHWQVKRIVVEPGAKLSLQMHNHRSEHWIIVNGTAEIQLQKDIFLLRENQSIYIPKGSKHRIGNPGKNPLVFIEVQTGFYLNENDIIRFEDDYGRTEI